MAIVLTTVSDSKQAQDDLAKLRESVNNIQVTTEKASKSFFDLTKNLAIGIAALTTGSAFAKYSDNLTNLNTRLKLATDSQLEFNLALKAYQFPYKHLDA